MLNKTQVQEIQHSTLSDESTLPRLFSVLGDPNRWYIFTLLSERDDLCVTDLANILRVSVPAVSQQLRTMEMSGLVRKERMGQMCCYQIQRINPVTRMIERLVQKTRKI